MKLHKLTIKNFKNISEYNIDFSINNNGYNELTHKDFEKRGNIITPNIIGLIGPNASGKSVFIEALNFASTIISKESGLDSWVKESMKKALKIDDEGKKIEDEVIEKMFFDDEEQVGTLKSEILKDIFETSAKLIEKPIIIDVLFNDGKKLYVSLFEDKFDYEFDKEAALYFRSMSKRRFHLSESKFFSNKIRDPLDNLILMNEKNLVLNFMKIADPSVMDYKITESKNIFIQKKGSGDIKTKDLSTGTKLYLETIFKIITSIKSGGGKMIMIDEIDPFMHTELAKTIILLMSMISKKKKSLSFLFTTHNMSIIDSNIRNSQIFEIKNGSIEKLSKKIKNHQSIPNLYKKGGIAKFKARSYTFDNIFDAVESL